MMGLRIASALQGLQRSRSRHQSAQNNCSRHTDALRLEIKLRHTVFAERDEWDAAEIRQRIVLEHDLGQTVSSVAGDIVVANAAQQQGAHMAGVNGC